jgi:hypothetical protein
MEKEDGTWRVVAVEGLVPDAGAADVSHESSAASTPAQDAALNLH